MPSCPTILESIALLVQEKKFKIDFQQAARATILDVRSECL